MLFESGQKLLTTDFRADIIFLDVDMPSPNGIETAKRLREEGCEAVIVFVTALREYVFDAFDVGAFHYLVKPFNEDKFREVLGKAVKLPVLGTVNRLLGLLLGAAKALLLIWLFLGVVSVLSYTGTGSFLYEQVEESALLSWLSRNNLFLQAMIRAGAELLS